MLLAVNFSVQEMIFLNKMAVLHCNFVTFKKMIAHVKKEVLLFEASLFVYCLIRTRNRQKAYLHCLWLLIRQSWVLLLWLTCGRNLYSWTSSSVCFLCFFSQHLFYSQFSFIHSFFFFFIYLWYFRRFHLPYLRFCFISRDLSIFTPSFFPNFKLPF